MFFGGEFRFLEIFPEILMTHTIINSDCLEYLRSLQDNTFDSIVTDPPYGLSFMGMKWDYDVPSVDIWRECLRVLKPGGHLLSFAGTRTQHRMAVNIEDAGFEIRDMIAWVYGLGFPKSMDVSKAIDKVNGEAGRLHKFTAWMRTTGLAGKQINDATGTFMGSHYLTDKSQPAIPTPELWAKLRPLCGDVPVWVDELVERIAAEREVVGQKTVNGEEGTAGGYQNGIASVRGSDISVQRQINITAPATDAAKQWQGWGTALKPSLEPVTMARKPLMGTVAENVLAHGTGALNIDGCRVSGEATPINKLEKWSGFGQEKSPDYIQEIKTKGRWPANLIHDGSDEVTGLFGTAARFFYCAKASKKDRDEGLEDMPSQMAGGVSGRADGTLGSITMSRNVHPTVKPTTLMRYLCRLITPPNGTILDPFAGSGSTGKAAKMEGFNFVGIEREKEYCKIAKKRIESAARYLD